MINNNNYDVSYNQIAQPSKEIPQIICSNCIQDLDSADRLRLQLLDADEYFSVLVNDRVRKMEVEDFEQDQPLIKTEVVDHQSHSDEYFNHIVRAGLVKPEPETKKKATIVSIPKHFKISSKAEVQIIKDSIKEEKLLVDDKNTQKKKELLIPLVPKKVPKKSFDNKVNSLCKELMKESEKAASAEKTTTVLSSKRHRKISSKLLESTEPAAKRIKRFHLSSMGGDDDKIKSIEKFPSKPPNDVKKLKAQTKISFECDTCSASFNSNLELNKHLNTHFGKSNSACFVNAINLTEIFLLS